MQPRGLVLRQHGEAGLQAEGNYRDSLAEIAKEIKPSLQNIEKSNKEVVKGFHQKPGRACGASGLGKPVPAWVSLVLEQNLRRVIFLPGKLCGHQN